ncbi:YqaA family protein [Rhodocista pekingensis]|uniref:YqaA family protein n=1 Tax=Rhodocista pekingensis TaxID=201185 RepID=A0ABW2L1N7_9PROT
MAASAALSGVALAGDPVLWGLFGAAFAAATLVPAQSEVLLVALLVQAERDPWLLVAVATLGNTLGSCVNWGLGRFLRHMADKPWFPAPHKALARAERVYNRWGLPSLLLAWTPFLGDPLTVVAGSLRVPFLPFVVLVALGKGGRYVVVMLGTLGWL